MEESSCMVIALELVVGEVGAPYILTYLPSLISKLGTIDHLILCKV